MKHYEIIEHTADIGIKVKADNLEKLFKNTAQAMFEIIAEKKTVASKCRQKIKIKQHGEDLEELLINWLNELLSLSATKDSIFVDFAFAKLDKNNLQATVIGEDIRNYKVNTEIKAATYHQLKLEETSSGWQAEVIFDV